MAATTVENADSKTFWEGARTGRLMMQKCQPCGHVQFPPRHLCARCWSDGMEWIECSGRGTVESFTVVHRAPTTDMRDKAPYVVAAILVEEGPRMMTNIVGQGALDVSLGEKVEVTFEQDVHGRDLPQFRRVGA